MLSSRITEPPDGCTVSQLLDLLASEYAETVTERTRAEYRATLRKWCELTGDPPIAAITSDDLLVFRDRLLEVVSVQTVKKHHRTLRQWLKAAQRLGIRPDVPQLYVTTAAAVTGARSAERVRPVRALITTEELNRLWTAAGWLQHPRRQNYRATSPELRAAAWRALLYLLWSYGIRVSDLRLLTWSSVDLTPCPSSGAPGRLTFSVWKLRRAGRVQSLPLTGFGRSLLRLLHAESAPPRNDCLVFPFLRTPGRFNSRPGTWSPGWRTAWQRELLPFARIRPTVGPADYLEHIAHDPSWSAPILPQNFRQTAVTELNDLSTGPRRIGAIVAGHTLPGTDAGHYDRPDRAIFDAIAARETRLLSLPSVSERPPECSS